MTADSRTTLAVIADHVPDSIVGLRDRLDRPAPGGLAAQLKPDPLGRHHPRPNPIEGEGVFFVWTSSCVTPLVEEGRAQGVAMCPAALSSSSPTGPTTANALPCCTQ